MFFHHVIFLIPFRCKKKLWPQRLLPELPGSGQRQDDLVGPAVDPGSGSPLLLDERLALPDGLHRPGFPEPEPEHGLPADLAGFPDEHPDGVPPVPGQLLRGTLELANVTLTKRVRTRTDFRARRVPGVSASRG